MVESNHKDESATISDESSATRSDSEIETETDIECPANAPPFDSGDKLLALHSSRWYGAKVRTVEFRDNEWRYLIHYMGWKEKWDEWVGVDRLRPYDEEVLQKQNGGNPNFEIRYRKQKKRKMEEGSGAVTSEKLLNLRIPPALKKQLVDDCEFVTHLGKLVRLPRVPNVKDILEKNYIGYRLKKDGRVTESVYEFVKGLEGYFSKSLPVLLLYKNEKNQHADAVRDHVNPSIVYGAEHLLRLFVKLPNILARAKLENDTLVVFQKEIFHFLKFLQRNQNDLFLSTYEDSGTSAN